MELEKMMMDSRADQTPALETSAVLIQGAIGGLVAGVVFLIAEMIGSVLLGGELLAPFKAFASIPLGQMPPTIELGTALPVGFVTHFALSILYGVIAAAIVSLVPALRSSAMTLIVATTIFGTLLWIINFLILPDVIGRPWFKEAPMVAQFIYHAFFYGTPLGIYLAMRMGLART